MGSCNLNSAAHLLHSCKGRMPLLQGKQLHLLLLKSGMASALYYGNCLLQMYTHATDLKAARRLFDEMSLRNSFTWNSLIDAHARRGDAVTSLELFNRMPHPKNAFSYNAVIAGLVRSGNLEQARTLLEEMPEKDPVALNSVMHGYVRRGLPLESLNIYRKCNCSSTLQSLENDSFVLTTALNACARLLAYDHGKQVHARVITGNVALDSVLSSSLVDMYGKCGDLDCAAWVLNSMSEPDEFSLSAIITGYMNCGRWEDARRIFDRGKSSSTVLWNSMLSGFASNGLGKEAFDFFVKMKRSSVPMDSSTLSSVFNACTTIGGLHHGRQVHAFCFTHGFAEDVVAGTALIDFYAKFAAFEDACKAFGDLKEHDTILLNSMIYVYCNCGRIQEAKRIFYMIPCRSLISWNSMIVGYCQNGFAFEAFELFSEMHRLGLRFDNVTLATVLSVCANVCSVTLGEQLFALATVAGLDSDQIVCTSLVDLYCKCGHINDARKIFNGLRGHDDALWNSMLMGYAMNGHGSEALRLFEDMRNANINLNQVTFIAVLTACCYCGLVEKGWQWFEEMQKTYSISPQMEHYACMVDILVHVGWLYDAVDFANKMPFEADIGIWTCLLRGCKSQGNLALGREVAQRLIEIDSSQAAHYIQLAGIYASQEDWERSSHVRKEMNVKHLTKNPGRSWI